uniref:CBS domain-containing protein n=1 Tax=Alexandrium catenella TaxID=2925 RepID=A0A7S1MNN4_ALECA|mmetsp:Transcript_30523/g.82658  ORF Transcript_30523/g.82658 Transcript_30523/m.82658 type:complete len:315 (+) Transcript_30523:124-1068(+)
MTATASVHVNWTPMEEAAEAGHRELDLSHAHAPPVVGDVVGQRGTVVCLSRASLSDAVDLLVVHDRTAAGVVDDEGTLQGVLTENDMVLAYGGGLGAATAVRSWLRSGFARMPRAEVPELSVRPSTTLLEAAARMRSHADGETACHHLVVLDEEGRFHGVLSSLDLARAICALQTLRGARVSEVMKPRRDSLWCGPGETLADALRKMAAAHQNCALVGGEGEVVGLVTPRDALRAFGDHVPLETQLGSWLRGLRSDWRGRQIGADAQVAEAAGAMAAGSVHHLVAVSAEGEVVGVVSTLDLARAIAADEGMIVC